MANEVHLFVFSPFRDVRWSSPTADMKAAGFFQVWAALAPILVASMPGVDQQIAFLESSNSSLLRYPTQFTQNIQPKMIHSHNDCTCIKLVTGRTNI